MTDTAYSQLTRIFERIERLGAAETTLLWESRTMMPKGGAATRAKVLATLTVVMHEAMTTPEVGELLLAAEDHERTRLSPWQAANLREMRRRWRFATALPADLVGAIVEQQGLTHMAWQKARADNDFKSFLAPLKALMTLQTQAARIKGEKLNLDPYDALLEEYEPGVRTAQVDGLFDDLAAFLPDLLRKITDRQSTMPTPMALPGPIDIEKQHRFAESVAGLIGFDFEHGRLDKTVHPFAAGIPGDIRITTRFSPNDVRACLLATVHETGHAMYEAGLPAEWEFQPVRYARGSAIHESQSLLFEMQASRSAPFVRHLAKMLREAYGGTGAAWSDENVLRLYRRVEPSLIRVDADEVTYPLHIILRYRLERAIVDGSLKIEDIPQAWNDMSRELLGIAPPTDTLGCLQDMHWGSGLLGYFPTYTLGALTAAQLFAKAKEDEPELLAKLGRGDFSSVVGWTRKHIHSFGSFFATGEEMLSRATGKGLSTEAFKAHLRARYLEEAA